MSKTIRKNNRKRIEAILRGAALITEFRVDDDNYDGRGVVTADDVLRAGYGDRLLGFDRVYASDDDAVTVLIIHRNWHFTAYASVEAARLRMTPVAFAKYFPQSVEQPDAIDARSPYAAAR